MNTITKIDQFHQQTFFVLLFAFLVALPCTTPDFFNITPLITALFIINELVFLFLNIKTKTVKKAYQHLEGKTILRKTIPFLLFYLVYLYGILISDVYLFDNLVQKLPYVIMPIVFAIQKTDVLSAKKIKILIWTLTVSCLISLFILIGHAFVMEKQHFDLSHYYYSNLSWHYHPTYISMIYLISIILLIYNCIKNNWNIISQILTIFVTIFLFGGIVLLFSRSTILATILTFAIYFIYLLFRSPRQILLYIKILAVPILCAVLMLWFMPKQTNRFVATKDIIKEEVEYKKNTHAANTYTPKYYDTRMQAWHVYSILGQEAFPKGIGIVGINEKGAALAKDMGYTRPYENKLNAHNQYLEIFTGMGLLGILIFGLLIFELTYSGFKYKNIQFLLFLFICLFSFCFEAILERQIGIMFFVFFCSFLQIPYFYQNRQINDKHM